jgi:hypothetical protein
MTQPTEPTKQIKRRKPEGAARDAVVPVRLTPFERDELAEIAEQRNTTLSGLLRTLALGRSLPAPKPQKIDADTYLELGRIGNNLNQIARAMNAVHTMPPLEKLAEEVESLRVLLKKVQAEMLQ